MALAYLLLPSAERRAAFIRSQLGASLMKKIAGRAIGLCLSPSDLDDPPLPKELLKNYDAGLKDTMEVVYVSAADDDAPKPCPWPVVNDYVYNSGTIFDQLNAACLRESEEDGLFAVLSPDCEIWVVGTEAVAQAMREDPLGATLSSGGWRRPHTVVSAQRRCPEIAALQKRFDAMTKRRMSIRQVGGVDDDRLPWARADDAEAVAHLALAFPPSANDTVDELTPKLCIVGDGGWTRRAVIADPKLKNFPWINPTSANELCRFVEDNSARLDIAQLRRVAMLVNVPVAAFFRRDTPWTYDSLRSTAGARFSDDVAQHLSGLLTSVMELICRTAADGTAASIRAAIGEVIPAEKARAQARRKALAPVLALTAADRPIGLYFSAHRCTPCRRFTPELAGRYTRGLKRTMEVVFCSKDDDRAEFDDYAAEMPWPALPYEKREEVGALFELCGAKHIPALVVVNPDGVVGFEVECTSDALDMLAEGSMPQPHIASQERLRKYMRTQRSPPSDEAAAYLGYALTHILFEVCKTLPAQPTVDNVDSRIAADPELQSVCKAAGVGRRPPPRHLPLGAEDIVAMVRDRPQAVHAACKWLTPVATASVMLSHLLSDSAHVHTTAIVFAVLLLVVKIFSAVTRQRSAVTRQRSAVATLLRGVIDGEQAADAFVEAAASEHTEYSDELAPDDSSMHTVLKRERASSDGKGLPLPQRVATICDALLEANARPRRRWWNDLRLQPTHLFRTDGTLRATPGEIARAIKGSNRQWHERFVSGVVSLRRRRASSTTRKQKQKRSRQRSSAQSAQSAQSGGRRFTARA